MSIADDIQKLHSLREAGALTDDEFNQAKGRLLNATTTSAPSNNASSTFEKTGQSAMNFIHRIGRSRHDSMLGGVCGGFALHSSLPSWVWRLLFASAILLSFGSAAVIYIMLWVLMPYSEAESFNPSPSSTANTVVAQTPAATVSTAATVEAKDLNASYKDINAS